MTRLVLVAVVLCLRLAGSEDLYWRPNTDWSEPSNWALGRVPCEGDVADLSSAPRGSVIKLAANAAVRSLVLPVGSTIVLGRSVTLRLSNATTCQIPSPSRPMVAPVEENNLFVGARPRYWECAENWESSDGTAAKAAPCGKDRAFFRKNHFYSTVQSNASTVTVQYLQVRGQLVTTELIPKVAAEFKLGLTVNPRCGEDPSLCPCFPDCGPSPPLPPSPGGLRSGPDSGQTAAIVVVLLLLILSLVALAVFLAALWLRWRHRKQPYKKDEPLGEPEDSIHSPTARAVSAGDGVLFDNPIYDVGGGADGKKGGSNSSADRQATKAHEMEAIAILRPSGGHYEPVDYEEATSSASEPEKKTAVLEDYERLA